MAVISALPSAAPPAVAGRRERTATRLAFLVAGLGVAAWAPGADLSRVRGSLAAVPFPKINGRTTGRAPKTLQ